ncbi:hypothetical protein N7490_006576 [Penicillium lividum]|nr:hypothetical protein N7490_006576 [Penicillium lividum]
MNLARFNRCAYYSIFRAAGPGCSSTLGVTDDAMAHAQFLEDIMDQLQRWEALGLQRGEHEACREAERDNTGPVIAPQLRTLSLSKVTLPPDLAPTGPSIFFSLQALTLRDCPNQLRLLRSLSRSSNPVQLTFFEACFDGLRDESGGSCGFAVVSQFLCSFRGLRHLHLRLSNYVLISIDGNGLFAEDRDVCPSWLVNPVATGVMQPLTALALCASPCVARRLLQPIARGSPLQILHLRFSGTERIHQDVRREVSSAMCKRSTSLKSVNMSIKLSHLALNAESSPSVDNQDFPLSESCDDWESNVRDIAPAMVTEADDFISFAEWAFGNDGLPHLQVLALGDFSHGDRYRCQQFVVRRMGIARDCGRPDLASPNCQGTYGAAFCAGETSDPSFWDRVSIDGAAFLSSCPSGGLLDSPYEIYLVAWSQDGYRLASGSYDKTVRIWDSANSQCILTLEGHHGLVSSIAWSQDGSRLASGSSDSTVKIWDLITGQCTSTLEGHSIWVGSIAWSQDGRRLASGSPDNTVRIWDLATSQCELVLPISSPSFLQFAKLNLSHLHTSIGTFDIAPIGSTTSIPNSSPPLPEQHGYGLSDNHSWITCNGDNLLWLPAQYRPVSASVFAISGTTVAIGCSSGRVIFLALSKHNPLSRV